MKIVKRLCIILITFLFVLFFILNAYHFIMVKVFKNNLAPIFGYSALEVVSGSMEPTIHVGDIIIVDTTEKNIKEKDIVTFYDIDGSFVTHRIVSMNEDEIITKGDNNNALDDAIKKDKIAGKYLFKITGAGKLLAAFKSPFVMVMILIIGLLYCFLVSTDKDGNPILTQEEKELQEFREYQSGKNNEKKYIEEEWKKNVKENSYINQKKKKKVK